MITVSFRKMRLKMSPLKWRLFVSCPQCVKNDTIIQRIIPGHNPCNCTGSRDNNSLGNYISFNTQRYKMQQRIVPPQSEIIKWIMPRWNDIGKVAMACLYHAIPYKHAIMSIYGTERLVGFLISINLLQAKAVSTKASFLCLLHGNFWYLIDGVNHVYI